MSTLAGTVNSDESVIDDQVCTPDGVGAVAADGEPEQLCSAGA